MSGYVGDYLKGDTVYIWWNTNGADGASITRATNGTVSVYKGASDTQTTTGVTDGEDTDSLTGVHRCAIATTDSFYVANEDYAVVLSAATIDGQTVNHCIGQFSISKRSNASIYLRGTAQSGTTTTTVLAAATSLADDRLNASGLSFIAGTGAYQSMNVTDYTNSSDTATHATIATAASSDTVYEVYPFGLVSATDANGRVDVGKFGGTTVTARDIGASVLLSSGTGTGQVSLSSGLVSLSGTQTFNVTGNITGNLSGSVGSVTGAVGSVTGAVGSVTGNVGGNVVGSVGSVTTVSDKTGYRLSATGVDDIWDEALSGHTTAGTSGATMTLIRQAALNKRTNTGDATSGTVVIRNDADDGNLLSAAYAVSGNVLTRDAFA